MNVEVSELSNMLPELVQRAGGGETVVVTSLGPAERHRSTESVLEVLGADRS